MSASGPTRVGAGSRAPPGLLEGPRASVAPGRKGPMEVLNVVGLPRPRKGAAVPTPVVEASVAHALRAENRAAFDASSGTVRLVTAYNEDTQARRAIVGAATELEGRGQWDAASRKFLLSTGAVAAAGASGRWSPARELGVQGDPRATDAAEEEVGEDSHDSVVRGADARYPGGGASSRLPQLPVQRPDGAGNDDTELSPLSSARIAELEALEDGILPFALQRRMAPSGAASARSGGGASGTPGASPPGPARAAASFARTGAAVSSLSPLAAAADSPVRPRAFGAPARVDFAEPRGEDPYGSSEIDAFVAGFVKKQRRGPMALRLQKWWRMRRCRRKYLRWYTRRCDGLREILSVWRISRKVRSARARQLCASMPACLLVLCLFGVYFMVRSVILLEEWNFGMGCRSGVACACVCALARARALEFVCVSLRARVVRMCTYVI